MTPARTGAAAMTVTAALIALVGCRGGSDIPTDVAPEGEARTLLLSVDQAFASLAVPADSRGALGRPPERIPLRGWEAGSAEGERVHSTALPIRTRNLYFFKPSPGMKVVKADGTEIPHRYTQPGKPPYWTYDANQIRVHGWGAAPGDEELFFVYPPSTAKEATLNQAFSGKSPEEFVRSIAQAGPESRSGLLLPAPGHAAWDLTIPPSADLRFSPALIRPEVLDGPASDGVEVTVTLKVGDAEHELWKGRVEDDTFRPVRVDLGAWAGQTGRLTVQSDPGADPRFDYLFLADPVVASRKASPKRVFLVFVDTLRPDHMGTYGYERATTPNLDRIAADAARFSQARSVAPWTLPSARTVLTGHDPERYFSVPTLQGRLREAGYATAMFAGNLYLSANFGLQRDWGLHHVELLPRANTQLDQALAWLDQNAGRDLLLLVHLMDAHLPYEEPKAYRRMFAGDPPETLQRDAFHRPQVMEASLKTKEDRQYLRDRYDNNVRFADDQLARLYERLGPDDVLVFFSDHGEEFWDHGSFEHGHTLFDELLRVPLIVRGPGVQAASIDAPVSLLDVTPTVLDLLGLPLGDLKGTSLAAVARGEPGAADALTARPQAFGRPLYGGERWGVLNEGLKYTTFEGREALHDLRADPSERKDLRGKGPGVDASRAAMAQALQREVADALRLAVEGARKFPAHPLVATMKVPGGIKAAWVGDDPTEQSLAELSWEPGSDTVVVTWPRGYRGSRDVWVVPTAKLADVTHKLTIQAQEGSTTQSFTIPADKPAAPQGVRVVVLQEKVGERRLELGFGVAPIPNGDTPQLSGYDPDLADQLKAMGYAVGDE